MRTPLVPLLCLAPALLAQAPPNYYTSVVTSSPAALRASLHAVIDDHTRFPYTSSSTDTWTILEQADENPVNSGAIVDVYRNASYTKIGGGVGAYNREHTWPKSYGFPNDVPDNYPYTDCHHLFLSDSGYNGSRSNTTYADANAAATERTTLATNGSGGGSGVYPGNSNWFDSVTSTGRWQTWGDRRGDVARAAMYMDVRYEGGLHGGTGASEPNLILTDNLALVVASNTGNNESVGYSGVLSTLLQWHHLDPVDQRERDRNDLVFAYQGNRNPFVDHPEWADCLYSAQCGDTVPPAAPTSLAGSATATQVALDWADNVESDLAGYRVYRAPTAAGPFVQISAALVSASAYVDIAPPATRGRYYRVRAVDASANVSADSATLALLAPTIQRALAIPPPSSPTTPWINELHYDNSGTDTGEFVEVAGPAGVNLSGWKIYGYNGNGGTFYASVTLTGTLPNQQNGYGTLSFAFANLQNGAPDGVALVDAANQVVQFLAYEGSLTAVDGPAAGRAAALIPTQEEPAPAVGNSLQMQGNGHAPAAFTWSAPVAATPGLVNIGQTLQ